MESTLRVTRPKTHSHVQQQGWQDLWRKKGIAAKKNKGQNRNSALGKPNYVKRRGGERKKKKVIGELMAAGQFLVQRRRKNKRFEKG